MVFKRGHGRHKRCFWICVCCRKEIQYQFAMYKGLHTNYITYYSFKQCYCVNPACAKRQMSTYCTWHINIDGSLLSVVAGVIVADVLSCMGGRCIANSHGGDEESFLCSVDLIVEINRAVPGELGLTSTCESESGVERHLHAVPLGPHHWSQH